MCLFSLFRKLLIVYRLGSVTNLRPVPKTTPSAREYLSHKGAVNLCQNPGRRVGTLISSLDPSSGIRKYDQLFVAPSYGECMTARCKTIDVFWKK